MAAEAPPVDRSDRDRRNLLAEIARREASAGPAGDDRLAGPEIEKYLALFRDTLNRRASTARFSDVTTGYPWCAAFVYWCCLRAGFAIAPEPSAAVNGPLAAVRTWQEWAVRPECGMLVPRDAGAAAGDLVLFDRLLEDVPLDHIGVVLGVEPGGVRTAEGNVHNRAGLFLRPVDARIHGYVRLRGIGAAVTLRPAGARDSEFAFRVKEAAFRAYVEAVWGWDEAEQRRLHGERFAAQDFRIVRVGGADAGVLATIVTPECVKLRQLFLLPTQQGRGAGAECVRIVQGEARALGLPVWLWVLRVNTRAQAFYRRLGFVPAGETETHVRMEGG